MLGRVRCMAYTGNIKTAFSRTALDSAVADIKAATNKQFDELNRDVKRLERNLYELLEVGVDILALLEKLEVMENLPEYQADYEASPFCQREGSYHTFLNHELVLRVLLHKEHDDILKRVSLLRKWLDAFKENAAPLLQ
jgi:hypothetical protein